MQITVTIPDELAARAQARGMTPEDYVERLIAEQQVSWSSASGHQLSPEEFNASLDALTQYSDKIPLLPAEALSRESLYEDHD